MMMNNKELANKAAEVCLILLDLADRKKIKAELLHQLCFFYADAHSSILRENVTAYDVTKEALKIIEENLDLGHDTIAIKEILRKEIDKKLETWLKNHTK